MTIPGAQQAIELDKHNGIVNIVLPEGFGTTQSGLRDEGIFLNECKELVLDQCRGMAHPKIIIHMNAVANAPSSLFGWIILLQKQMASQNGKLCLCGMQPTVVQVTKLLKLHTFLNIYDTADLAVAALK